MFLFIHLMQGDEKPSRLCEIVFLELLNSLFQQLVKCEPLEDNRRWCILDFFLLGSLLFHSLDIALAEQGVELNREF